MAYRLNKIECKAIEWYGSTRNLKINLSLLPTVTFIDKNNNIINVHIKVLTQLYEGLEK